MKPHYFDDADSADREADSMLKMSIAQGYVPKGCRLSGQLVFIMTNNGEDPCAGCECQRQLCGGRPKISKKVELMVPEYTTPVPKGWGRDRGLIRIPD